MKKQLLMVALAATLGACSRNPDPEYTPGGASAPEAAAQAPLTTAPVAARMPDAEAMRSVGK